MQSLTPDEIDRLTPLEQLALTQAQQAELDHRLASLDEDRSDAVSWAVLKAELEQRRP